MKRLGFLLALSLVLGCPKGPTAVLSSLEKPADFAAIRDAFNADVEHRRVLVLLSPH